MKTHLQNGKAIGVLRLPTRSQPALLVIAAMLVHLPLAQPSAAPVTLTRVKSVRSLTLDQSQRPNRVRLRGVVTAVSGFEASFFFQDASAGIAVDRNSALPIVRPGDAVEIDGVVSPGLFAPSILARSVVKVGASKMPPAKVFGYEQLRLGQQDSQWGDFIGVVRSANVIHVWGKRALRLLVKTNGGTIDTRVRDFAETDPERLVDATVRVRGVFATNFNDKRQLVGVRAFVSTSDDVVVLKAAPSDPFSMPARAITSLQQFAPGQDFSHRVRLVGTAIYQNLGHALYIQDAEGGVIVRTAQSDPVSPGQVVEAIGFASSNEQTPALEEARFRVMATRAPPEVSPVLAADVFRLKEDGFWSTPYDSRLVSVRGRVVDNSWGAEGRVFLLRDGNRDFNVILNSPTTTRDTLAHLEIGSVLRVTGVCSVFRDESGTPVSFKIMLRSPEDVATLEHPNWLTPAHLIWLVIVAFAMAVWKAIHHEQKQKKIARELMQSRKRFQLFLDSSPSLSYIKDREGRMVWVNRSCEKLWNIRLADWIDKTDFDLWPLPIARKIRETDVAVLEGGIPVEVLEEVPQNDGKLRHFVSTKFPFETENGEVMLGGTSIDITERVNMEALLRNSELRYRELFEHNPVPAWVYCLETLKFLDVNEAAVSHYGYSRDEFLNLTVRAIRPPEDFEAIELALCAGPSADRSQVWRHRRKDGSVISVELRSQDVENNSRRCRLVMANDVTERIASEEKFRVLFEESSDAHLLSDDTGVIDCNQAAVEMLRADSKHRIIGVVLNHSPQADERESIDPGVENIHALNSEKSVRFDCVHSCFDGTEIQVEVSRTVVSVGTRPMVLEVWHDLTVRKERERKLAREALTDPLTGLPNRRHFAQRVGVEIHMSKLDGHRLSLCACDVDHFKLVNDCFGHAAGDEVLATVGKLLRESVRQSDFVARMGGDEFCILFSNSSPEDAAVCLTRFQKQLEALSFTSSKGVEFKVTLTLGVAELLPSNFDEQSLAEAADRALYAAKEQGRNRIVIDADAKQMIPSAA